MELILKLKDDSKLDALLDVLRRFISSERVDVVVESPQRGVILESPKSEFDWARFDEIMNCDKLLPGQPEMSPEDEENWIAKQVRAMRAEESAQP